MRSRRSGYTLVELMVVLAVTSTTLAGGGAMLHLLFRIQGQAHVVQDQQQALFDFARQFRRDAHAAQDVTILESEADLPPRVRFTFPAAATVEYSVADGRITRTKEGDERTRRQDRFRWRVRGQAAWSVDRERARPLVRLEVIPQGKTTVAEPALPMMIQAAVGLAPGDVP